MTLVASNLPPSPVSQTTKSTLSSRKIRKPKAVAASNRVGRRWTGILRITRITASTFFLRTFSRTARPPIWKRSRNSIRWGEV